MAAEIPPRRSDRRLLGEEGERRAAHALERAGYVVVGRNVHVAGGELDLIARDGDMWVFVEVKTRRGDAYGSASESVTPTKQARLLRAALTWMEREAPGDVAWRFDVVTVRFHERRPPDVEIIRNAFGEDA